MLTNDELDLARAKAMAWEAATPQIQELFPNPERIWRQLGADDHDFFTRLARAIRTADAAMGVVSVPVVATERMISEGESAASVGIGKPSDEEALPRVWCAMLAANPLREKSDET